MRGGLAQKSSVGSNHFVSLNKLIQLTVVFRSIAALHPGATLSGCRGLLFFFQSMYWSCWQMITCVLSYWSKESGEKCGWTGSFWCASQGQTELQYRWENGEGWAPIQTVTQVTSDFVMRTKGTKSEWTDRTLCLFG